MKFKNKIKLGLLVNLLCILYPSYSNEISTEEMRTIEAHIETNLTNWQIPGLSIAIIDGKEIINKNYGYSNNERNQKISAETLFEIGSTSKAFTGLGILLLEEQGQISLNDPITNYIPWLKVLYNNEEVILKIEDLLYHKSGIPFHTIAKIPPDIEIGAIERVVRNLVNINLDFEPGSNFSYATINYDVLGLLIETVTEISFEKYIKENILSPLGLDNTYTNYNEAVTTGKLSQGYKINLLRARSYKAPYYRGNVPAGYIISSSNDISRWLQIQMGIIELPELFNKLIKKSQNADLQLVTPYDNSSYATGWFYYPDQGGFYSHSGSNPNFSSFFAFNSDKKKGIVVLANINSDITVHLGVGILDILYGTNMLFDSSDMFTNLDKISFIIIIVFLLLLIGILALFGKLLANLRNHNRKIINRNNYYIKISIAFVFYLLLGYLFYCIPSFAYDGVDWNFIIIWASALLLPALIILYITLILIISYLITISSCKKESY